ncbi:MAG: PQQ-dependent sugar dehydrogenase [Gammaproteobacteria bacterium]
MFRGFRSVKTLNLIFSTMLLAVIAPFSLAQDAPIKTEQYTLTVDTLASGLVMPWSVALLPDGLILVTEKSGNLRVLREGRLLERPVSGLPTITPRGQGGLLDVVAHPDYRNNRMIFWSYAAGSDTEVGTDVARGRLVCRGDECSVADVQVIFSQKPKASAGHHFGSRLVFDRKGNLFVTLGDRGRQDDAQNLGNHLGGVMRITETGGIPADNPFAKREGAMPEIFTYGNRNVQGAAIHPRTGELWATEHGPQGGDELNILRSGRNYGWPVITHGRTYGLGAKIGEGTEREDIPKALKIWLPQSIAPSGLSFYTGTLFPQWRSSLFLGSLREQMLIRLTLDGDTVTSEERISGLGRVRDVREGSDGALYVLSESTGKLFRLTR